MSTTEPVSPAGGSAVPAAGGAVTAAAESPVTTGHLRRVFLGPRGGGTLRRRASDALRLGFAVLVVAVSIPVMRANSAAEAAIVHALNPPPAAISWLVTTLFWLGSAGVVAGLAILALLVPRLAAVLAAMAVRAGVERTAAAAGRVLDDGTARGALVHLQRAALDPVTVGALREHKDLLAGLRTAVAASAGIEVPKLAEPKRISWVNLVFGIGSLIGLWAISGMLSDAAGSLEVIKGASWGWVALAFVLAQLPIVAQAWVVIGAVPGQLAAYLPPIWGWVTLAWMRRREYV